MKVKLAVVLVTWLYAFALAVPPLLGWGDYITDGYKISCCFDYLSRNPENRSFIFYLFTGGFGVPLAIILVSYTKIFIVIRANEKQMKMQKHNGKSPKDRNFSIDSTLNSTIANEDTSSVFNRNFHTGSTPMIIYKSSSQSTPLIQLKSRWFHRANSDVGQKPTSQGTEVRLAKVILIVIVVFIGSWAPYAILALIGQFGPPDLITPEVSTATAVLAKISVVYNPFIYGWKDFGFRQKLRRILRGSKDRKQSTVDNRLLASTFSL